VISSYWTNQSDLLLQLFSSCPDCLCLLFLNSSSWKLKCWCFIIIIMFLVRCEFFASFRIILALLLLALFVVEDLIVFTYLSLLFFKVFLPPRSDSFHVIFASLSFQVTISTHCCYAIQPYSFWTKAERNITEGKRKENFKLKEYSDVQKLALLSFLNFSEWKFRMLIMNISSCFHSYKHIVLRKIFSLCFQFIISLICY
jgi:hypothetical protein